MVLVGPHEHHSNLLPWRESSALVVSVPEDARGGVDRAALARLLERYAPVHPLVIGAFAAASNVTGIEADVDGISEQLHRAGALAVWDYAAAAPFAPLDMNPVVMMADGSGANPYVYKDAALVSTHKMAGGAGAPGVLLAKRRLFSLAAAPSTPGGGTVFFVTSTDHRYLSNREEREEGGTPDVVGAARAGLAFAARADMLRAGGHARDRAIAARVDGALRATPRLAVAGRVFFTKGPHDGGSGRKSHAVASTCRNSFTGSRNIGSYLPTRHAVRQHSTKPLCHHSSKRRVKTFICCPY